MQILPNTHISAETAYVVEDYPFGFRLRCTIRYWLDCKPGKGARLVAQTTNPKKPGVVWNKPKMGTFSRFGGALFLDDAGHVQMAGISEYSDGQEAQAFKDTYGPGVPDMLQRTLNAWVISKVAYDKARADGDDSPVAAAKARLAVAEANSAGVL